MRVPQKPIYAPKKKPLVRYLFVLCKDVLVYVNKDISSAHGEIILNIMDCKKKDISLITPLWQNSFHSDNKIQGRKSKWIMMTHTHH